MSGPVAIVEVDAFTSSVLIPAPGDDVTAAGVEVYTQSLSNRARYTLNRMQLADRDIFAQTVDSIAELARFDSVGSYATADLAHSANPPSIVIPLSLNVGDVLLIEFSFQYRFTGANGSTAELRIVVADDGVTGVPVTGTRALDDVPSVASPPLKRAMLRGYHTVTASGSECDIFVEGKLTSGGAGTLQVSVQEAFSFVATLFHVST